MNQEHYSDYDVLLKKKGYFTIRGSFTSRGKLPGWFDVDKFMKTAFQKAIEGATIEFGNVNYDSGSWYIRPVMTPELNKIVIFLNDNPSIDVEIGAHTDSLGNPNDNIILSQKRAKGVVDYLVGKGIPAARLTWKGYGATQIKNRCEAGVPCRDEEHRINRRTEIKVLKINA